MSEELPTTKPAGHDLTVEEITDALTAEWDNPLRDERDRRLPGSRARPGWSSSVSPATCPARS